MIDYFGSFWTFTDVHWMLHIFIEIYYTMVQSDTNIFTIEINIINNSPSPIKTYPIKTYNLTSPPQWLTFSVNSPNPFSISQILKICILVLNKNYLKNSYQNYIFIITNVKFWHTMTPSKSKVSPVNLWKLNKIIYRKKPLGAFNYYISRL